MRQGFRAFEQEYPSLQNLRCVEIGVWEGGNAKEFVDGLKPIDAWLVDPWADWRTQPEVERDLIAQMGPDFGEQVYQKVVSLFKNYPNVHLLKMYSNEAVHVVPDGLDFVYVDGEHTYKGVIADIELWLPKLKSGGWMIGDDYGSPEVARGVNDYVAGHGIYLNVSDNVSQWWFVK